MPRATIDRESITGTLLEADSGDSRIGHPRSSFQAALVHQEVSHPLVLIGVFVFPSASRRRCSTVPTSTL